MSPGDDSDRERMYMNKEMPPVSRVREESGTAWVANETVVRMAA